MIKVFGETDTTFTSNGDIVIQPFKCKVHREDIEYYCDIEVPIDYIDDVTQGKIIVVKTPQANEQAFRVNNVTKTGKKISAHCRHVFFDSLNNYYVEDARNKSGNPLAIMLQIKNATEPTTPFTFGSSITTSKTVSAYYETLYNAIMKVVDAFECYLFVDNYTVFFNETKGQDKGVVIQYGKNLKEISCDEDWSDVCTRIYPYGANGCTVMDSLHTSLPVPYIDGSVQYGRKYIKAVEFDQSNIKRSDYQSDAAYHDALVTDLIAKANAYLTACAYPKITYTLKAYPEDVVGIGDTIVVIDERLGVELETYVTAYDYDCLTGRYTDITFGNYRKTAKGMGLTVNNVAKNQRDGIIAEKRILFNADNSITWENIKP